MGGERTLAACSMALTVWCHLQNINRACAATCRILAEHVLPPAGLVHSCRYRLEVCGGVLQLFLSVAKKAWCTRSVATVVIRPVAEYNPLIVKMNVFLDATVLK